MGHERIVALWVAVVVGLPALSIAAEHGRADFRIQDSLGRSWSKESVRFTLSRSQTSAALRDAALISRSGVRIPYQVVLPATSDDAPSIEFITDLDPYDVRDFTFIDSGSHVPPVSPSDLAIEETSDLIRISNRVTGIAIRKTLLPGEGPIAAIRLASGKWIGESGLESSQPVVSYSAHVVARGPIFAEIHCKVGLEKGGSWELHVRLQSLEPAIIVEESFSTGDVSAFRLILNHGFAPKHVLHRRGKGAPSNNNAVGEVMVSDLQPAGEAVFRLEPWLHWWENERQGNWFALYDNDYDDLVAVGALEAGVWVDPTVPEASRSPALLPLEFRGSALALTFPLRGGKRRWLISTHSQSETLAPWKAGKLRFAPLPQAYVIKHGDFPLTRVKDYVLKWEGAQVSHPRLFVTVNDLAQLRSRPLVIPHGAISGDYTLSPYALDDVVASYLATESSELGSRLASTAVEWVQEAVNMFTRQEAVPTVGFAPHQQWRLLTAMNLADAVLSSSRVPPDLKDRLAAQTAFLAYTVARPDYWSPERGFAANPNMSTIVATYRTILACMIPTHPLARNWVKAAMQELKTNQLDVWADAQGGWLEAPHYAVVSYDHMLASFLAAKNSGFNEYLYDPKMKLVANWLAKISTPMDLATGNRHLPPIGNTYVREPTGEFGVLAYLWRAIDADFSSSMQWMHHQQGAPLSAGIGGFFAPLAGYRRILSDSSIPEQQMTFTSEWFTNTGVVLRSGGDSTRETQLYLIAGANHAHYDRDSGSFTLWGKGRVVADDFGYSGMGPGEEHSMVTSPHAPDSGTMHITHFVHGKNVDYVSGTKNDAWQRQIIFMKDPDPLGPNYFVIHDQSGSESLANSRIWFAANDIRVYGRRGTAVGREDVDTEFFFTPQAGEAAVTAEKSVASWGINGDSYGRVTTTQKAIILPVHPRLGLTTVLFPRLKSDRKPLFKQLADGRGVRIDSPAGTDYVFLSSEPFEYSDGSVNFRGMAGAIKLRGGTAELWLGRSGKIAAHGQVLQAEK